MSEEKSFQGFSRKTVQFFEQLADNNNKIWFENHRSDFEAYVMEPAKAFVVALGVRLKSIAPNILAIPKVNKSIFRINRDTRFSLDPSPYKTNLGIYFWDGMRPRMESTGFYFHIEPPTLILGAGFWMFTDRQLERFRKAVVDPKRGKQLTAILKSISNLKGYELGGKHYKRIPAGYDPRHPNAEFLLYNGLHVGMETAIPKEFYSSRLVDYCLQKYQPFGPLHKWLVSVTA
jgi:uncharacterized protein (TIGR02453 family)